MAATTKGYEDALGRTEKFLVCDEPTYVEGFGLTVKCGNRHPYSGAPVQCGRCRFEQVNQGR